MLLLLYPWFKRAQFCWCIVCRLNHPTYRWCLSLCLLSVLARFSGAQQFGLDKHQRACVLLRISRNDMGSLVRGRSALMCFLVFGSLSCVTDSRRVFLRYQRHLSKISPGVWQHLYTAQCEILQFPLYLKWEVLVIHLIISVANSFLSLTSPFLYNFCFSSYKDHFDTHSLA